MGPVQQRCGGGRRSASGLRLEVRGRIACRYGGRARGSASGLRLEGRLCSMGDSDAGTWKLQLGSKPES